MTRPPLPLSGGNKIPLKYMNKPTNTPIYFPPITRRPIKYPSFRPTTFPTTFPTTEFTPVNTTFTILNSYSVSKLSQSNIIIIVSVSTFFIICIMVISFIIYNKRDKKQREIQFHHWLKKEANIRVYWRIMKSWKDVVIRVNSGDEEWDVRI